MECDEQWDVLNFVAGFRKGLKSLSGSKVKKTASRVKGVQSPIFRIPFFYPKIMVHFVSNYSTRFLKL